MGSNLTTAQLRILKVLHDRRGDQVPTYGADLMRQTRLPSGTVYRSLDALESAGLVVGKWEDIDESREGRRARRYLSLTGIGVRRYEEEVALVLPRRVQLQHV